ncbi:MAG: hypothetical protein QOK10_665 [Pseudonocardiales bacterium]|nr:hypothetical protein [Pseudonocardiales bacterium]
MRPNDPLLTIPEVAEILRVTPETLRYWRMTGMDGPESFKIGRRVVYYTSSVAEYVAKQEAATSSSRERSP